MVQVAIPGLSRLSRPPKGGTGRTGRVGVPEVSRFGENGKNGKPGITHGVTDSPLAMDNGVSWRGAGHDAPWRSAADAYYRHHWACRQCIAAGRNQNLERCAVGLPLWRACCDAIHQPRKQ